MIDLYPEGEHNFLSLGPREAYKKAKSVKEKTYLSWLPSRTRNITPEQYFLSVNCEVILRLVDDARINTEQNMKQYKKDGKVHKISKQNIPRLFWPLLNQLRNEHRDKDKQEYDGKVVLGLVYILLRDFYGFELYNTIAILNSKRWLRNYKKTYLIRSELEDVIEKVCEQNTSMKLLCSPTMAGRWIEAKHKLSGDNEKYRDWMIYLGRFSTTVRDYESIKLIYEAQNKAVNKLNELRIQDFSQSINNPNSQVMTVPTIQDIVPKEIYTMFGYSGEESIEHNDMVSELVEAFKIYQIFSLERRYQDQRAYSTSYTCPYPRTLDEYEYKKLGENELADHVPDNTLPDVHKKEYENRFSKKKKKANQHRQEEESKGDEETQHGTVKDILNTPSKTVERTYSDDEDMVKENPNLLDKVMTELGLTKKQQDVIREKYKSLLYMISFTNWKTLKNPKTCTSDIN